MSAPITLVTPAKKHEAEVISLLEELLARAKAGEFSSAMVFLEVTESVGYLIRWTGQVDAIVRAGRIEHLKHAWLTAHHAEGELVAGDDP